MSQQARTLLECSKCGKRTEHDPMYTLMLSDCYVTVMKCRDCGTSAYVSRPMKHIT